MRKAAADAKLEFSKRAFERCWGIAIVEAEKLRPGQSLAGNRSGVSIRQINRGGYFGALHSAFSSAFHTTRKDLSVNAVEQAPSMGAFPKPVAATGSHVAGCICWLATVTFGL